MFINLLYLSLSLFRFILFILQAEYEIYIYIYIYNTYSSYECSEGNQKPNFFRPNFFLCKNHWGMWNVFENEPGFRFLLTKWFQPIGSRER